MQNTNYEFYARKFTSRSSLTEISFSSMTRALMALEPKFTQSCWAFDSSDGAGLFSFGKENNHPKAFKRLSDFIEENAEKPIALPESTTGEFAVHHFLAKSVIQPLCGSCCLSKHDHEKAAKEKKRYSGLVLKQLGMGDENHTWHGSLDMMSKVNTEPFSDHASSTPVAVERDTETLAESDEGFRKPTNGLPQVTAQTIVYSLIHHRRYPRENPLVPGILFSETSFTVVMYDCVDDVLLQLSDSVELINPGRVFNAASVAFLWTVLHHGMFLNWPEKTGDDGCATENCESGFLKWADYHQLRHHYENLSGYHKTFGAQRSRGDYPATVIVPLRGMKFRKRWSSESSRDDEESPKKNKPDE